MTYVDSVDCDDLRIILCLEFEPHAVPEDVAALKSALIDSPNNVDSLESTGDFDFITEISAPHLGWFNRWWKTMATLVSEVFRRCEKSFVCKRFIRRPKDEVAIWVRCGNELKRIEHSSVDKIVADGDYARVYAQGQSWLLHATMHSFIERLSAKHFLQLHRSLIVRASFIESLVHEGRHWVAHLRDGTSERVAKSHAEEALRMTHWPNHVPDSSKRELVVDAPVLGSTKS